VNEHTTGFDALLAELEDESFAGPRAASGATRADMARFARMYARPKSAVLVWSMGITQHEHGVDNVRAIVNLALARGNVGRPGAGLMPIRGHSGVQGGAEMGCYATAFPGGVAITARRPPHLGAQWGFPSDDARPHRGRDGRRGARGNLDVLWSSGGNFLDVLPAPDVTRTALARAPLRVHQDIVLSQPDARRSGRGGGAAARRDALRAGRRGHLDHDRAPGRVQPRDPGTARRRGAQRVADLRRHRAPRRPEQAELFGCESADAIRAEIARVVPEYAGIEQLHEAPVTRSSRRRAALRGGVFPTARRQGPLRGRRPPNATTSPTGTSCCRPGGASSSTRWCGTTSIRSRARDATRCSSPLPTPRARRTRRRGGAGALAARRDARPRARRADPARATCRRSSPRRTRCSRRRAASPISGVPDYNAVVEVVPVPMTSPDALIELLRRGRGAVRLVVGRIDPSELRARTDRPGSTRST
jgi:hypothetical protein